jgi:hypothetical protein
MSAIRHSIPQFPTFSVHSFDPPPAVWVRRPIGHGDCWRAVAEASLGPDAIGSVIAGDRVGRLTIIRIAIVQKHGWPCRCTWGICNKDSRYHPDRCCCALPVYREWLVECECGWRGYKRAGFSALTCGRANPDGSCLYRSDVARAA